MDAVPSVGNTTTTAGGLRTIHFKSLFSTHRWAQEHLVELVLQHNLSHTQPVRITADEQTAGIGQATANGGRKRWIAPADSIASTFVLVLPLKLNEAIPLLPFVASCAILRCLERIGIRDNRTLGFTEELLSVKWINDILCNRRKIAGILCHAVPIDLPMVPPLYLSNPSGGDATPGAVCCHQRSSPARLPLSPTFGSSLQSAAMEALKYATARRVRQQVQTDNSSSSSFMLSTPSRMSTVCSSSAADETNSVVSNALGGGDSRRSSKSPKHNSYHRSTNDPFTPDGLEPSSVERSGPLPPPLCLTAAAIDCSSAHITTAKSFTSCDNASNASTEREGGGSCDNDDSYMGAPTPDGESSRLPLLAAAPPSAQQKVYACLVSVGMNVAQAPKPAEMRQLCGAADVQETTCVVDELRQLGFDEDFPSVPTVLERLSEELLRAFHDFRREGFRNVYPLISRHLCGVNEPACFLHLSADACPEGLREWSRIDSSDPSCIIVPVEVVGICPTTGALLVRVPPMTGPVYSIRDGRLIIPSRSKQNLHSATALATTLAVAPTCCSSNTLSKAAVPINSLAAHFVR